MSNTTLINKADHKKGATLVEILIYVIIFTFLLALVVNVFFALSASQRHVRALKNIEFSAVTSLERVHRAIREASTVNVADSVLNTHPGRLSLVGTDVNGNPLTTEIYTSDGAVVIEENNIVLGTLTSSGATTTGLVFSHVISGEFQAVKMELSLQSGTSTYLKSKNFYMTAALRGSY